MAIFKKETVLLAGGYDDSTMGEDMELVVKLHVSADQIILIFYTVCARRNLLEPGTEKSQRLIKQRRRWHIGLFESLTKYKNAVGKKSTDF